MKTFYCDKCSKLLGEMTKGKLLNGTILICKECCVNLKLKEDSDKLRNTSTNSMPDFFKDIFPK